MSTTLLGYLLTILSAAAFASTSLFLKMGLDLGMSVWSFTLIHSIFSLMVLGSMLLRTRRGPALTPRPPAGLVVAFALAGAAATIAFNVALVYLSISLGTILLFTYPAFVAVGAWLLLGQRPGRLHLAALALTLAGAVLTTGLQDLSAGAVSLLGMALALLASMSHAMYIVWGEQISTGLSATVLTTLTRGTILGGVVLLHPRVLAEAAATSWQGWLLGLLAAGVAGVAPFFFLNRGIALIGANRAAIASVAELPVALALGLMFTGDVIRPLQWAGAMLVTAAVIVSQVRPGKREESSHGSGTGTA